LQSKSESLSLEYLHLFEQQSRYFEEQMRRIEQHKAQKIHQLEEEFAEVLWIKEQNEKKIRGSFSSQRTTFSL
jgi:hypothetical protein